MANTFVKGGIARASGAVTRSMGPGMNLDWPYPSSYNQCFTNLMKQHGNYLRSDNLYSNGEDSTTGWPLGVTAASNIKFFIITTLSLPGSYVRPGTYKARVSSAMSSAGWTVQFSDGNPGAGIITSISAAGSTCTCVVTDLGTTGDWNGTVMNLILTAPSGGGPYNLSPNDSTAVECYFQANETRLNNFNSDPVTNYANMFDPDLINDCSGFKVIRFKDAVGTDVLYLNGVYFSSGDNITCKTGITNYSYCRQEAFRTWQMPTSCQFAQDKAFPGTLVQLGGQVPYSVCAKLAKATGTTAFISLPAMNNSTPYDVDATTDVFTARGHSFVNGDPVVLGTYNAGSNFLPTFAGTPAAMWTVYYVRDVVPAVSFKLARTLGGAAIDVTVSSSDGGQFEQNVWRLYSHAEYMALYTSIAQEMYAAAPGIDIILDVSNEVWNAAPPYGYHQFIDCVSANTSSPGAVGAGYAWACMRAWAAFESVYPRKQLVRMLSGQGSYAGNGMHAQMYGYTDPVLYVGQTAGQLVDVHCCEGYLYTNMTGQPFPAANGGYTTAPMTYGGDWLDASITGINYTPGDVVHWSDGNNYTCILTNTPTNGTNNPPNATYWTASSSNGLSGLMKNYTNAQWSEFSRLVSQANAFWRQTYKSTMDAYVGSRIVPLIHYECGFDLVGQSAGFAFTDVQAVCTSWTTFLTTQQAEDAMREFGGYLKSCNVTTATYYIGAGQWRNVSATNALATGLKRSHHLADTAFTKMFKAWRP